MIGELESAYSGLHQERNKLSTIILGAQEGMIATDAAGQIVLVNPAAEQLLQRDFSTLAQQGLGAVFDDPQWPQLLEQDKTQLQTIKAELQQQGKQLQIQLASIANEQGEPIGTAVLMRDITQEKALRQRLEHQSRTDALTGLFNRRYFDQELHKEFQLAQRYQQPVSLVLFDIDHFKKFNDQYGHDQGDRVLQAVAEVVSRNVQHVAEVCRYGGEEFAVIMPGSDLDGGCEQAEKLRRLIGELAVDQLQVTSSFGVAMVPHAGIDSPEALVKAADEALYRAKEGGRNRVEPMTR
jgi:diguanylate cyclase (GGDEF)-like protein/PAS domain S-box-containing protein